MQRVLIVLVVVLSASAAFAQDERRAGLVLAYPGSVGVQWQASGGLGIRFEADYSHFKTSSTSFLNLQPTLPGRPGAHDDLAITQESRSRNVRIGLSALIDVYRADGLRLYLAPNAGVSFESIKDTTVLDGVSPEQLAGLTVPADHESQSRSPHFGLALGARHDVSNRLRVFGEAGFTYQRQNTAGDRFGGEATFSAAGLRGGAGVVILF